MSARFGAKLLIALVVWAAFVGVFALIGLV